MSKDEPVEVKLGSWKPPDKYGDPELEARASKPWTDVRGPITAEAIDRSGETAQVFSFEGDAYAKDISVLQKYRGEILTLRHPAYSGTVYIESMAVDSTDRTDAVTEFRFHDGRMRDVTEEKQVYTYRVGLVAVGDGDQV
ncbi:MAG: hypothetical protein ACOCY6_04160 [Halodesulfurarchaeum sp.]